MTQALGVGSATPPDAVPAAVDPDALDEDGNTVLPTGGDIEGMGLHLHVGQDGSISLGGADGDERDRPRDRPRDRYDRETRPDDEGDDPEQ
jgi:penicillin-binding protein 1A